MRVQAQAGAFPESAELSVKRVPVNQQRQADAAIDDVRDEDQNVAVSYTFDIKVIDPATGEELQPADGFGVQVSFALSEAGDDNLEASVYHVTDEGGELTAEKLDADVDVADGTVTAATDGFSLYTVEFTYNILEYAMPDGGEVALSEILANVGLSGAVTAVAVSDPEMLSASDATGEWVVTAQQAFTDAERMKVTINGVSYDIDVTNATASSVNYIKRSWDGKKIVETTVTEKNVTVVPKDGKMTSGKYFLNSNVIVKGRVSLTGNTELILGDGYKLDVKGLYIPQGKTPTIYAQSKGTGELYSHPGDGAAIGAYKNHKGGAVVIHGGKITAEGASHCAGIGGNDGDEKNIGAITIYGGTIKATGGNSGAGIGGGRACEGGNITIYGGTITARGGHYGAGIGGKDSAVTLGWTQKSDFICASSYSGDVTVDQGQTLYDRDSGAAYTGTLTPEMISEIAGSTLVGYVPLPTFRTHSLLLTGEIGVNFFMELPELEGVDYGDSYMEFTVHSKNGAITRDDFDETDRDVGGRGYYGFTCYVNAIQMAAPITAVFHYGDGKTVEQTYSVKDYIVAYDAVSDRFDKTTTALVHAAADYGHYAQPALADYNGWKIGTDYAEMDQYYTKELNISEAAAAVAPYDKVVDLGKSEIEKFTCTLNLLTQTEMRIIAKPKDGYKGNYSFKLDGKDVEAENYSGGRYAVRINNIPAHKLDDVHTFTVVTASGTAKGTFSPLTYVCGFLKDNRKMYRESVASLYYYYKAAENYRSAH